MLIVQKFGGSSVANNERLLNVAKIVTDKYKAGNDVVVVVSAQGDTTDDLIAKAKEVNPNASKREMDVLMSSGEQISSSLLAMAIESLGFPVVSLQGWQIRFNTSSVHSSAKIKKIETDRISNELDKRNIVVCAGFQGVNKAGDITTLGRNGSDTSAVALAAALRADRCQIYTDVDGVYTADPRVVKSAVKLDEITYDEMLELSTLGASVLHNRSVEIAKKYGVKIEVLSSLERKPGTIVKEVTKMEKMLISGVACDEDVSRITVCGLKDVPGIAFKIFSLLAQKKINVDIILQSRATDGSQEISATVKKGSRAEAVDCLQELIESGFCKEVLYDDDVAKVSLVGAGMEAHPGVASSMFEALYDAGINIQMISTSEIKISVLINKEYAKAAMKAIHEKFIG